MSFFVISPHGESSAVLAKLKEDSEVNSSNDTTLTYSRSRKFLWNSSFCMIGGWKY